MPSLSTALGAATRLKLLQKPGRGTLNEADFVAFVRLAEDALRSPSNSASGSSQAHRDPIRASKSSSQNSDMLSLVRAVVNAFGSTNQPDRVNSLLPWISEHVLRPSSSLIAKKETESIIRSVVATYTHCSRPMEVEPWFLSYILSASEPDSQSQSKHISICYAALIESYCKTPTPDSLSRAIFLLNTMISHSRIKPSLLTYTHLLKGFAALDDIVNCKLILEKMTFMGHEPDLTFYTILIQAYAKAGDVQSAMSLHESVTNTMIVLDTRYYNALINMYAKASNRDNNESLATMVRLYEEMTVSLVPDEHTYTTMIDAFMKAREPRLAIFWFDVMQGRKPYSRQFVEPLGIPAVPIHPPIIPTAPTYTAIISGYAHQKNVAEALRWFQELCQSQTRPTEGNVPNIKTYTAVLHGFSKVGDMRGAENWIRRMENDSLETNSKSGFDRRVFNTLISGYASKHDYEGARKVLSQMGENGLHSDAITYGMLIDSHLKRTSSFKDGDIEAALQTYKTMISQGIKPTLHILTALISRLGHICGKSDSLGRPVISRQGGGLPHISRQMQSVSVDSIQLSPGAPISPKRPKAVQEQNLCFLYDTYRASISKILNQTNASNSEPPLPIYDSVAAHYCATHSVPKIKETVYHALIDGANIDTSLLVRAAKGIGRAAGWYAIYAFSRDLNKIGTDLLRIKTVELSKSKGNSPDDVNALDGLLMPMGELGAPKKYLAVNGAGRLVSGLLDRVDDLESAMHRWMKEEDFGELMKKANEVLIASYLAFAFQGRSFELRGADIVACSNALKYDADSRKHFIGVNLVTDVGVMDFWKFLVRIQSQAKASSLTSSDFKILSNVLIRHCELNGLWTARDDVVIWLRENGSLYNDKEYRKWLGSSK